MSLPPAETPRFDHPPAPERMFDHDDHRANELAEVKGSTVDPSGAPTTITVALPARNEEATLGDIVATIHDRLVVDAPVVDELLVIDDGSTDATASVAAEAGAKVIDAASVLPQYGSGGKGEALWKSLRASQGDLIVWCDADIRNFDERFVLGVVGPLLKRPDIGFVKGFYRRPLSTDGEGGGRVTELVARPLIATLFPDLGHLIQPLSGEYGGRRQLLESVPFHRGYAVDLGLLIDIARRYGVGVIGQADLGARLHRNRPLRDLGPQAAGITAMALDLAGIDAPGVEARARIGFDDPVEPTADALVGTVEAELIMARPEFGDTTVAVGHLPPMGSVPR